MANIRLSKKYALGVADWLRGLYMYIASPVLFCILDWLDKEEEPFSWRTLIKVGFSAALPYLVKNGALEPAKTIVTSTTNEKAETATEKVKEAL